MKKFLFNLCAYGFLILLALELLVRLFYLGKDNPVRFIDKDQVEKWVPNQQGYSVTGIRRQNFTQYHINNSGFNSYREFEPSEEKIEIALLGDSFVEGFHQPFTNSIGRKIENQLDSVEVYEYGYSGYDFADVIHLMYAYKEKFRLIDHIFIDIKFSSDLKRGVYSVSNERMRLESEPFKLLKKSKLIVFLQSNGFFDPVHRLKSEMSEDFFTSDKEFNTQNFDADKKAILYLENFKNLVAKYGYDKEKIVLLLNKGNTNQIFLNYLSQEQYKYLDYGETLDKSALPTTLIYDQHWNDHGRTLIAKLITEYLLRF